MSRVHDALRRAEQAGLLSPPAARPPHDGRSILATAAMLETGPNLAGLLEQVEEVPFRAATDSLLIDISRPHEAPMEEFRTLRTRLNHMKSLQPIHSIVVTSPSPAEGKSLSAANLALAESHLAGNSTLLADFDFRRPIMHTMFGMDRSPGITDYLLGKAPAAQVHQKDRRDESVCHAGGRGGHQSAGAAESARSQAADGPAAEHCSTGSFSIVLRCCSLRTPVCFRHCATARCWWCASATPPSIR